MTTCLNQVLSAAAYRAGSSGATAAFWVSITALVISLTALTTSVVRDRRLLLLRILEYLTTIDQQSGRREIHRMAEDHRAVGDLTEDQRAQCNHALAALNIMAIYYDRNWVSRHTLLQFWAEPVLQLMPAAQPFLAHRDDQNRLSGQIWPELRKFADAARKHGRDQGWDLTDPAPGADGASGAVGQP